jgi:NADPH2:quinone reductase
MWTVDRHRSYRERIAVAAEILVSLPTSADLAGTGGPPVAYMTPLRMFQRAGIQSGDHVLVSSDVGGPGIMALQLLGEVGVMTIGESSDSEKLTQTESIGDRERTRDRPRGPRIKGARRATSRCRPESPRWFSAAMAALRRGGTMVVCGRSAGGTSCFDAEYM